MHQCKSGQDSVTMLEAVVKELPSKQLDTLSLLWDTGASVSLMSNTAAMDSGVAVDSQSICPKVWVANIMAITNFGIGLDGAKALICWRTCVSMNIVPLNFWPEFLMGSTPLEDGHAGPSIKELPREQVQPGFRSLQAVKRCFQVRSKHGRRNCH